MAESMYTGSWFGSGDKLSAGDAEFEWKYRKLLEDLARQQEEEDRNALMRAYRATPELSALERALKGGY